MIPCGCMLFFCLTPEVYKRKRLLLSVYGLSMPSCCFLYVCFTLQCKSVGYRWVPWPFFYHHFIKTWLLSNTRSKPNPYPVKRGLASFPLLLGKSNFADAGRNFQICTVPSKFACRVPGRKPFKSILPCERALGVFWLQDSENVQHIPQIPLKV